MPVSRFTMKETAMPRKQIAIRRATADDSRAVHDIVLRALRETNARDYPASVIDRLVSTLPEKVASNLDTSDAFVAIVDGRVVGTASLSGHTVKSVFVHPDYQRGGVATRLMGTVENAARAQSIRALNVQSSITAQPFYAVRGFNIVREEFYGEERTIVMSKAISGASE
jgi:N-acetylglutamate synthase-like GNAT family acetyltransferase